MLGSSFFSRIVFTVSAILVFICLFVATLNYFKFERLLLAQQSRVMRVTAHDLAETLERSINLGVRLMNVADAQALLDRNWTGNRGISRLSVVDSQGIILFDTNRAQIGQKTVEDLRAFGATQSAETIRALDLFWVASPIINSFGQTEGVLFLAFDRGILASRLDAIGLEIIQPTSLVLLLSVPLGGLLIFLLSRTALRRFAALERALLGAAPKAEDPALAHQLAEAMQRTETMISDAERALEADISMAKVRTSE